MKKLATVGKTPYPPCAMRSILVFLVSLFVGHEILAGELKTAILDWKQACDGSAITVTSKDEQVVLVETMTTHFSETREWICPFKAGVMVSATYRECQLIRGEDPESDQGVIESKLKRLEVFAIREGAPHGMGDDLKKDFEEFMQIVKAKRP